MSVEIINLSKYVYVFLRIFGFVFISPVFVPFKFSYIIKIIISLAMTFMITPLLIVSYDGSLNVGKMILEFMLGFSMGFIVKIGFDLFLWLGEILDYQAGLSMTKVLNTITEEESGVFPSFLYILSISVFFSLNAHIWILNFIYQSFIYMPYAKYIGNSIDVIISSYYEFMIISIKFASPLILILIIVEIALGFFSKIMPNINFLILGQPIRLIFSISFLYVLLYGFISLCENVSSVIFEKLNSFIMRL